MKPQDRERFAQAMLVLAETIEIALPDGSLARHWPILQQYPWPLVERGLQRALCRRWGQFPKPNELAELIEAAIADMAERAWLHLHEAVRAVGPHHSIRCEDPALAGAIRLLWTDWPTACRRLREAEGAERTMLRKDFVPAYRLAWERAASRSHGYLPGLREIWQANGLAEEELLPVMLISDADRPRPLAILGGTPVPGRPAAPDKEPGEPLPPEQAKALMEDLVTQLSRAATPPRRVRRRLPPAMPEGQGRSA